MLLEGKERGVEEKRAEEREGDLLVSKGTEENTAQRT